MTTAMCIMMALSSLWCNLIFDTRYDNNAIEQVSPFYIPDGDPSGKVVRITGNYAKGMMSAYSAWWERVMYNYDSTEDDIWNDYECTNMAFKGTVGFSAMEFGDYFHDSHKPTFDSQLAPVAYSSNGPDPEGGSTSNRVIETLTRVLDLNWLTRLFSDAKNIQNQHNISSSKMLLSDRWLSLGHQDMASCGWLEYPYLHENGWKYWEHIWPVAHATGTAGAGVNNPLAPIATERYTLDTLVSRSLYSENFWYDHDESETHIQAPMDIDLFNHVYKSYVTNLCWRYIEGGPGQRINFWQQSAVNLLINMYDTSYVPQDDISPTLPWERRFYDSHCSTGGLYFARMTDTYTNQLFKINTTDYPYELRLLPYEDLEVTQLVSWAGSGDITPVCTNRASFCVEAAKYTGFGCEVSVTPRELYQAMVTYDILTNAMEHLVPGGMVPESEARLTVIDTGFRHYPAWIFEAPDFTTNTYTAELPLFFPTQAQQSVEYFFRFSNAGKICESVPMPEADDVITPCVTRPTSNAFERGVVSSAVVGSLESRTFRSWTDASTVDSWWPGTTNVVEPASFAGYQRIRTTGASSSCGSRDAIADAMADKMLAMRDNIRNTHEPIPSDFLSNPERTIPVSGVTDAMRTFFRERLPAITGGGQPFLLEWADIIGLEEQTPHIRIARGYDPDCFSINEDLVFEGGFLPVAELVSGTKDGSVLLRNACLETPAFNNEPYLFYSGAVIDFMTKIRWNYFNLK